jgi:CDP-glycerol glycerophosphotransferase (TagB/SpsB family)
MKNYKLGLLINYTKELLTAILGWIFIYPFALFIPKNKKLVIFSGRYGGQFEDNAKYLFLYALQESKDNLKISFLTEDKVIYSKLKERYLPVLLYPSFKTIYILFRTNIIIADHQNWIRKFRYFILNRAKKIQLWHGVGFKIIQKDYRNIYQQKDRPLLIKAISRLRWLINGDETNYDLLISPSNFYTKETFSSALNYKKIIEAGYSRNDILLNTKKYNSIEKFIDFTLDNESIQKIINIKNSGGKIIGYAPTFRDSSSSDPFSNGAIDTETWIKFCKKNNFAVLVKSHPSPKHSFKSENHKEIIHYNYLKDIYPFMHLFDLLITDYSSIYLDFLLLKKPIIFYPYDYEEYIKNSRGIKFDYNSMTPGEKCYNQNELEKSIYKILIKNEDNYVEERKKILLEVAFKYQDDKSSKRIWDTIVGDFL